MTLREAANAGPRGHQGPPPPGSGFTLIELLIVVAIILVLIAIALPNFLEAQIRAKVTKAKSDIRVLAIAVERYRLDWNIYPGRSLQDYRGRSYGQSGLLRLLEPSDYLLSLPDDPFPVTTDLHTGQDLGGPFSYFMTGIDNSPGEELLHPHGGYYLRAWLVFSPGPDSPQVEVDPEVGCMALNSGWPSYYTYAPTNGTRSRGDLWLFGGESKWMGYELNPRGCIGEKEDPLPASRRKWVWYDNLPWAGKFPQGSTL